MQLILDVRDVWLGFHEEVARDENDPLIGSAAGRRGQFRLGSIRDVDADDGKITGSQFKNVGAVVESNSLATIGVRVLADAAEKFDGSVHAANA